MSFKSVQIQSLNLSGSGVSIGDTTMTLSSFKTIDGVNLALSDFGSAGYMTVEPGSRDREEQISFSGVTQNSNGTATLTGIKTVLFLSPYTESSGFAKSHPGGVVTVVTNTSGFYNKLTAKDNSEAITGYWTVPDPLSATGIANKEYVDNLVSGGNVSVNALIEIATAGETVSAGQVLYLKAADGRWWKADASTSATVIDVQLGIAQGAGTAGNVITGGVLIRGIDSNQSGITAGSLYYVRNGGGLPQSTAGTFSRIIGNGGISATKLAFDSNFSQNTGIIQGIQNSSYVYAVDAVGTDDYAITISPTPITYTAGQLFQFKAGTANTGAATLAVNGGAAKAIKKNVSETLVTGDILASQIVTVIYDGTNFQLISKTKGYDIIGQTILGGAATSITVSSLPVRENLKIIFDCPGLSGDPTDILLRFNSDSSSLYGYRTSLDFSATPVVGNATSSINLDTSTSVGPRYMIMDIGNPVGASLVVKTGFFRNSISAGDTNGSILVHGTCSYYIQSGQISSVTILITTNNLNTGTRLTVLGSD